MLHFIGREGRLQKKIEHLFFIFKRMRKFT
jgi:hypothetical protein